MAQLELRPYKRVYNENEKNTKGTLSLSITSHDIYVAVASFLISRATVLGGLMPFGPAFFACFSKKSDIILSLVLSVFGLLSAGAGLSAFKYLGAMLIFLLIKKTVNKNRRFGMFFEGTLLSVSLFICGFIYNSFDMILIYDTMLLALESIICGSVGVIFASGIDMFDKDTNRGFVSNEQLLGISLVIGAALLGMYNITRIGSFAVSEVILVVFLLLTAFVRSSAAAVTCGIVGGMIVGMGSGELLSPIAVYCVCALAAGCAKPLGKIGVAISFLMMAVIMSMFTTAFLLGEVSLATMAVGSILFVLLPKKLVSLFGAFVSGVGEEINVRSHSAKIQAIVSDELDSLSVSFDRLSKSVAELSGVQGNKAQYDIGSFLAGVSKRVCKDCGLCTHCWQKEYHDTVRQLSSVQDKLEEKGYIDILDLNSDFRSKCVKTEEFAGQINHLYEVYRLNYIWSLQAQELRSIVVRQYDDFKKILSAQARKNVREISFDSKAESRIASLLLKNHIRPAEICVYERPDGYAGVQISIYIQQSSEDAVYEIEEIVSDVLGRSMTVSQIISANFKKRIVLEPSLKYSVSAAVASVKKDGQAYNGDSCSICNIKNGGYLVALSDGMGSGEQAAKESGITVNILKQLLNSGMDIGSAVRVINSALVLKSGLESFATVDAVNINLLTAEADFIKIGSAPTFICRKNNVSSVESSTLPAGIFSDVDLNLYKKKLAIGDVILMVSDGVSDINSEDKWIENTLAIMRKEDAQIIADKILSQALSYTNMAAGDDMTVIAIKIFGK